MIRDIIFSNDKIIITHEILNMYVVTKLQNM
jgi:hypothetical protein